MIIFIWIKFLNVFSINRLIVTTKCEKYPSQYPKNPNWCLVLSDNTQTLSVQHIYIPESRWYIYIISATADPLCQHGNTKTILGRVFVFVRPADITEIWSWIDFQQFWKSKFSTQRCLMLIFDWSTVMIVVSLVSYMFFLFFLGFLCCSQCLIRRCLFFFVVRKWTLSLTSLVNWARAAWRQRPNWFQIMCFLSDVFSAAIAVFVMA